MAQTAPAADPRSLQELAVDIVTDVHKLATGLAHAGADPKITAQIEQTGQLYSSLAKALAAGPVGQQGAQPGAAPPPQPGAPQAASQAPPAPAPQAPGPPAPGPGGPQAGMPPGQGSAHGALHNAIVQAHADAIKKAQAGPR